MEGGYGGGRKGRLYTYRYTVTTRMTPSLRWAAMIAILMFHNCEGQSYKTVSTNNDFWRERRAEADSNRGPSAYQPNALPLGQTGALHIKGSKERCLLPTVFLGRNSRSSHSLFLPHPPFPVPNKPSRLCGRKATCLLTINLLGQNTKGKTCHPYYRYTGPRVPQTVTPSFSSTDWEGRAPNHSSSNHIYV